jgi:hypothetical protein
MPPAPVGLPETWTDHREISCAWISVHRSIQVALPLDNTSGESVSLVLAGTLDPEQVGLIWALYSHYGSGGGERCKGGDLSNRITTALAIAIHKDSRLDSATEQVRDAGRAIAADVAYAALDE